MQLLRPKITTVFSNCRSAIVSTFAWIAKLIRELFSRKKLNQLVDALYAPDQSDELKAFSAAFGVFIGIIPIWGLQTLIAVSLAILLKLNKALVVVFSQISFPPLFPFIIFLSYKAGAFWMCCRPSKNNLPQKISFTNMNEHLAQYLCGSITLAIAAAIITGAFMFAWLKIFKIVKQNRLTAKLKKA